MPSKTTVIQLNRRVQLDPLSTDALKQSCSANTICTKNTPAIEEKLSWSGRKAWAKPPSIPFMCLMCDLVPVKVWVFRLPVSFFLCARTRWSFHTTGPAQAKCQSYTKKTPQKKWRKSCDLGLLQHLQFSKALLCARIHGGQMKEEQACIIKMIMTCLLLEIKTDRKKNYTLPTLNPCWTLEVFNALLKCKNIHSRQTRAAS